MTHKTLAGEPPFTEPTAQAVLARLLTSSPTHLTTRRQNLASGIGAAVLKAMSKEPADRFGTAEKFARAMSTVSAESLATSGAARRPPTVSRKRWVAGGIALVLLATAGLFVARRTRAFRAHSARCRRTTVIVATREWYQGWVFDAASRAAAKIALRNASSLPSYYALAVQDTWLRHDERAMRALADSSLQSIGGRLAMLPHDERLRMMYAFSYAYAGQCRTAIAQGDSANATRSVQRDAFIGAGITQQLAQVLALCGERDRALALADTLLKRPVVFTAGWMRIDPYFMLLRNDPRYIRLSNPR